MRALYSAVYNEIKGGVKSEWDLANISNDELIAAIFGKEPKVSNHNPEGSKAFDFRPSA